MAASLCSRRLTSLRRPFLSISCMHSFLHLKNRLSIPSSAFYATESAAEKRGTWSKILLFLNGEIPFGFATWQYLSIEEKIDMLNLRRKHLEMDPIFWNQMTSSYDFDSLEFRRVVCDGYFDKSRSIFVRRFSVAGSRVKENGFNVITPFIPTRETGSVQPPILVNRGWVPGSWLPGSLEDSNDDKPSGVKADDGSETQGRMWWNFWFGRPASASPKVMEPAIIPLRVIGVARRSEKSNFFLPANDPENNQWSSIDVPTIARARGLPEDTLYIEDINEETDAVKPYLVPKDVNAYFHHPLMPKDHLYYAILWYCYSAAATFLALKKIRPRTDQRWPMKLCWLLGVAWCLWIPNLFHKRNMCGIYDHQAGP